MAPCDSGVLCVWQVWGMVLLDRDSRLLTGSADSELRAWDITYLQEVSTNQMNHK